MEYNSYNDVHTGEKTMKAFPRILLLMVLVFACSVSVFAQGNPFGDNPVVVSEDNSIKFLNPSAENEPIKIKEVETVTFSADSARATSFLYALKRISDRIVSDNQEGDKWYWSNSKNKRTFKQQEESKVYVCNNALLVVWGLAECGVFKNNEKFYTRLKDGRLIWNTRYSDTKKNLLKCAEIIKVKGSAESLIKAGKVKAGDICCSIECGTFVYAGNDMWFDASRDGCENRVVNGKHYYESIYSAKGHPKAELTYVIRLNDSDNSNKTIAKAENDSAKKNETAVAEVKAGKNLAGFLASLKKISDIVKDEKEQGKPWFYSNSKNKNTMSAQRKSGIKCCNCALMVVWALADCGVFQHNEKFYGAHGGAMAYRNGAKAALEKYCTITHPNKTAKQLIKEGKLKEGDICCYPIQHTNVYAGNNKWWDAGRGSGNTYKKGGTYYFNSFYSKKGSPSRKVTTLIRFKK